MILSIASEVKQKHCIASQVTSCKSGWIASLAFRHLQDTLVSHDVISWGWNRWQKEMNFLCGINPGACSSAIGSLKERKVWLCQQKYPCWLELKESLVLGQDVKLNVNGWIGRWCAPESPGCLCIVQSLVTRYLPFWPWQGMEDTSEPPWSCNAGCESAGIL